MSRTKYPLPDFLVKVVSQKKYVQWLGRKAQAHFRRDSKKGVKGITRALYKGLIHEAVRNSEGLDAYTGEKLHWGKIAKFDGKKAQGGRIEYMRQFKLLPTIDHAGGKGKTQKFKICSWIVNDAKNHLTIEEFKELCRKIVNYRSAKSHLLADIPQKALIKNSGKVLIVFDAVAKVWELPGGRVEVGEEHNLPDALAREIREELGTEIKVGHVIDVFVFEGKSPHCVVTYECELIGSPESIKVDGVEVGEVRWVSLFSEVADLPMQEGYRKLLKQCLV